MRSLTVRELKRMFRENKDIQIIDVREDYEMDSVPFEDAIHIPLFDIRTSLTRISKLKDVIFVCRSGHRSLAAVEYLSTLGFNNTYNLDGGLVAWSKKIDKNLKVE